MHNASRDKTVAYWACWALAGATAEQHDYARAWHYQHLGTLYQDSMHIEESGRRQAFARHNVTLARQQARIALLKDRELARLRQQRLAISLMLLAVLLLSGGGAASYLVRQRQRLAADLHDEVGSLLTRLSLESSLLREGLAAPHEQQRQFESLVSVSQQAQRHLQRGATQRREARPRSYYRTGAPGPGLPCPAPDCAGRRRGLH